MATTVLITHEDAAQVLIEQTRSCISASWAVAWATPNKVFDAAMARMEVFNHLIVGTHGSQSHPRCLRALASHPGKGFIRRNAEALFHPKLYIFEHAKKYSVVIGSHNLTGGAFQVNEEVSLLIDFEKMDPAISKLLAWMVDASRESLCVVYTPAWLSEYESLYALARQKRREIDEQRKDTSSPFLSQKREVLPINLSWDDWYARVSSQTSPSHAMGPRLDLLDYVGGLFKTHGDYASMPPDGRMRIAGVATKQMIKEDMIDWDLFGRMTVLHQRPDFKKLVLEEPAALSHALDHIPLEGPVNEAHWGNYWTALRRLDDKRGTLAHGMATRLATLRRPDVFVSLNGASTDRLAELLDVPVRTLVGDSYWTCVIQPVQRTRWFAAEEPQDEKQVRAWRARAALLDSLVYARSGG